jgi:hypothetical protein
LCIDDGPYHGTLDQIPYHGTLDHIPYLGAQDDGPYHGTLDQIAYLGALDDGPYHGAHDNGPYHGAHDHGTHDVPFKVYHEAKEAAPPLGERKLMIRLYRRVLFKAGIEELHGGIAGANGGTGLEAEMGVKMIAKESATWPSDQYISIFMHVQTTNQQDYPKAPSQSNWF